MESFVGNPINFVLDFLKYLFLGKQSSSSLLLLDDEKCFKIIINKSSSSEQLKGVKDFLVREISVFESKLSNIKSLLEKAESEYQKVVVREYIGYKKAELKLK